MCKLYKAVINLVAEETEIPISVIESKSRHEDVVSARQMVAYFCSKARMPHSTIAQHLGITRQAVCQKIETINDKRMQKSFEFNFRRIEAEFAKIFEGVQVTRN